jgi:hypothetical protein
VVNTAWIGLVGALGGVLLTGAIGLITAVLNRKWQVAAAERDRQYRTTDRLYDLRREAYVRYLQAAQAMGDGHKAMTRIRDPEKLYVEFEREIWPEFDEVRRGYDSAMRDAKLLATQPVLEAIEYYDKWLNDACKRKMDTGANFDDWTGKESDLIEKMRAEQEALPTVPPK